MLGTYSFCYLLILFASFFTLLAFLRVFMLYSCNVTIVRLISHRSPMASLTYPFQKSVRVYSSLFFCYSDKTLTTTHLGKKQFILPCNSEPVIRERQSKNVVMLRTRRQELMQGSWMNVAYWLALWLFNFLSYTT